MSSSENPHAALRRRLEPQLPKLGITRVADLTDLDDLGIPVFGAVRPWSRNFAVSQGKGLRPDEAWLGAVLEALELLAAEAPPEVENGESGGNDQRWPTDLDQQTTPWIQARSWPDDEPVRIPLDMAALDLTRACQLSGLRRSSNGLAGHRDRRLAIRHGLLEALERHALAAATAEPRVIRELDTESAPPDRDLQLLLSRLHERRLRPRLWLLPSLAGTFTVKASLPAAAKLAPPVFGAACDVELAPAAVRALLECVQSRVTRIAGARDDLCADDYAAGVEDALARLARRPVAAWQGPTGDRCDLERLPGALGGAGFPSVFVVDLPCPSRDVVFVKVIVPGLLNAFTNERAEAA